MSVQVCVQDNMSDHIQGILIAFDLETTGKHTTSDPIQLGACAEPFGQGPKMPVMLWSRLIHTQEKLTPEIRKLTGIDSVKEAQPLLEVLASFKRWVARINPGKRPVTLVSYNGTLYDLPVLANALRKHGSSLESLFKDLNVVGHMDLLRMVRMARFCESYTLVSVYEDVFKSSFVAHNASNDAMATLKLYHNLVPNHELAAGVDAVLGDVWRAMQSRAGVYQTPHDECEGVVAVQRGNFTFFVAN